MPPPIDLTGRTDFGRWTVLRRCGRNRHKKILWWCRCACGAEHAVTTGNLTSGTSTQCRQCADAFADHGGPRTAKPKPPRLCDHCGRQYQPKRLSRSKYCSDACKASERWREIAADPARKAAHSRRVTADHKRNTYVAHAACDHCGEPFRGPPTRLHCSRECLDATIRTGKYRNAFHRRRVAAEMAALSADLERRLADGPQEQ
jgi:hypothetical protein